MLEDEIEAQWKREIREAEVLGRPLATLICWLLSRGKLLRKNKS